MLNEGQTKAVDTLVDWYVHSNEHLATLQGWAGTGKTYTSKYFFAQLGKIKILVCAPTNQAKSVIEDATGLNGKTIHSLLGLMPNTNLSEYDPSKPVFEQAFEPDIDYDLIAIDESSMINKMLYEELEKLAVDKDIKILFIGDQYQLPPIKESISSVFTDVKTTAKLDEMVRQGDNNPNTELIYLAVQDVIQGKDRVDEYILKHSDNNITPSNLEDSKGFVYIPNSPHSSKDFFLADRTNLRDNLSKYFGYTNNNITKTSRNIRKDIFELDYPFVLSELLVGYRSVSVKEKSMRRTVISNSETYEIMDVETGVEKNMQVFNLKIKSLYSKSNQRIKIVNLLDDDTRTEYNDIVFRLYDKAMSFGKGYWVAYYNFINEFLSVEDIIHPTNSYKKIKPKCIDYGYSLTVHKSQGSTYKNSFISMSNINSCRSPSDKRRLKYVVLSRCEDVNLIL